MRKSARASYLEALQMILVDLFWRKHDLLASRFGGTLLDLANGSTRSG